MKKWWIAAGCSVLLWIGITGGILPQLQQTGGEATGVPTEISVESESSSEPQKPSSVSSDDGEPNYYVVREYEGNVAVFAGNSAIPLQILEMPVSALPKTDRNLLKQGVRAENAAELSALLEDYS